MRAASACTGVIVAMVAATNAVAQRRPLAPGDVISRPAITEVQLAPDGRRLAYTIGTRDMQANRLSHSTWLWTRGEGADSLPIGPGASQIRWRADGTAVSYLAPDSSGITQVWQVTPGSDQRQVTAYRQSISSYEWSPDNQRLAVTTSRQLDSIRVSESAGIIIDNDRFFISRLFEETPLSQSNSHYGDPRTRIELWVHDLDSGEERLVSDSMSVRTYAWSPDSRRIAIAAHGRLGRLPRHLTRHDLTLYSFDDGRLRTLETGSGGDYLNSTVMYDQPFWSPDGTRVAYFRLDLRDRWEASGQLGIYSLTEERTILLIPDEQLETYQPRGIWLDPDTLLLENTYRGGRRLFAISAGDGLVTAVIDSVDWLDQHSFSRDGETVAFVREAIDLPPDLYISDRSMRKPKRVTNLHAAMVGVRKPRARRVNWAGADGVRVEGWLYLPRGEPPYPLVVFVHGGPAWVFGNRYEPYLYVWPYAFGVFAERGLAVFAPNYRGTGSYGKAFRRRSALDAEPIRDIVAGLDTLIGQGIADPARLGIVGHSHGCWLGPLIAVRHRRFRAASCAAGTGNWSTAYQRNVGWMNSEIVEYYWGGGVSPYEDPERYRNLSPVFGFQDLKTAFLFEYGALTGAAGPGMEYATAAWRAGVPHEFVIYRDTGHNVTEPRIMLEVLNRNLDWFEFWLLDREKAAPNASERAQYERWRTLRELVVEGVG